MSIQRDSEPAFDHPAGVMSPRLQRYVDFVSQQRKFSAHGGARLSPDGLYISITENCNFRCVGCYTEGLFKKTYVSVEDIRGMLAGNDAQITYIDLTEGEAFLHPELCEIIEACKAAHPEATIDLVTNASIPIRGKYRQALSMIDRLGVSIDGSTKQTYESIRKGGNFQRFLANVRDIVAVRVESGNPKVLEFSFTAMTTNIVELPGVVRIASEIGIPNVYYQPMEMRGQEIIDRVGAFNLDQMPIEDVYQITDEAIRTGRQLGVAVYGAPHMTRPRKAAVPKSAVPTQNDFSNEESVRSCQYLWTKPFQYVRDGDNFEVLPCCYMLKSDAPKISARYGLAFNNPKNVAEVYNSEGYWQMRQDLAEGNLDEFCGGCKQAKTHPWREIP